jgi:hypothetical protein
MTLEETKKKYDDWNSGIQIGCYLQAASMFLTMIHFNFIYFFIGFTTFTGICFYMTWKWMNKYHDQKWEEWAEQKKKELFGDIDFGNE